MTKSITDTDILEAAAALFCEKGYAGTTTRDIAAAVGAHLGSITYRFPAKEMILEGIMTRGLRRSLMGARQMAARKQDPASRLAALMHYHFDLINDGKNDIKTILLEWRHVRGESSDRLTKLRDQYEEIWAETIDDLFKDRKNWKALDIRVFRFCVLGALNWTHNWRKEEGPASNQVLADVMIKIFSRSFECDEFSFVEGRNNVVV